MYHSKERRVTFGRTDEHQRKDRGPPLESPNGTKEWADEHPLEGLKGHLWKGGGISLEAQKGTVGRAKRHH